VEEVEGSMAELWAEFGRLWCGGKRARAHRSKGGNAARFLRLGLERAREREREAEAGVKAIVALWCSRDTPRPDRWARGQRTDATACPHGSKGLCPVGHDCALNV
jgi:hypothetical protein